MYVCYINRKLLRALRYTTGSKANWGSGEKNKFGKKKITQQSFKKAWKLLIKAFETFLFCNRQHMNKQTKDECN